MDVTEDTFSGDNSLLFYVGASRARLYLDIVTAMDDEKCERVLINEIEYKKKIKKPRRELALALNAMPIVE